MKYLECQGIWKIFSSTLTFARTKKIYTMYLESERRDVVRDTHSELEGVWGEYCRFNLQPEGGERLLRCDSSLWKWGAQGDPFGMLPSKPTLIATR